MRVSTTILVLLLGIVFSANASLLRGPAHQSRQLKKSNNDVEDLDDLADLLEDTFEDYDLKCKVNDADSDNGVPEEDGDKADIKCKGDDKLEVTLKFELKKKGSKDELKIELCVKADKGKKACEAVKVKDVGDAIDEAEELIDDEAEDLLDESLGK